MRTLHGLALSAAGLILSASILINLPAAAFAEEAIAAGPDQLAQAPVAAVDDVNDPFESVNRAIFSFNEVFYDYILRPVATFYRDNFPDPVRKGINNMLANLNEPVVFANDVLQGKPDKAMEVFGRFLANSTVGFGGIRDVTEEFGWSRQKEDFGQTLGVWGVGEGPYLVLPIFGSSNPRDAIGKYVVDGYADLFNNWADNTDRDYAIYSRAGVDGVDTFAGVMDELDEIKKTSIDYYAAIRSMYRQKRDSEIRDGKPGDLPPIPDMSFDLAP